MKVRLAFPAVAAVAAVVFLAACGPVRTATTTLQQLPAVAAAPSPASPYASIVYRLGGALPPLPATAPAYDIAVGNAERQRIASALGIAAADRHLLIDQAGGWWSFDAKCEAAAGTGTDEVAGFACSSPAIVCAPAPTAACRPPKAAPPMIPVDLPSRPVAVDRARSLLRSLGVDVSPDNLHVTDGVAQWLVSADPIVGGRPTTGRATTVTIGPKTSILAARGFLGATVTKLGDYRLVDAATTGLGRLVAEEARRPRPMIASYMPCRADVPDCGGPPVPQVVIITGVHLALQQIGSKLVPAFVFEAGSDQTAPPVPAVIDSLLPWVTPTVPPAPKPVPGQPGQVPGISPAGPPTKP